MTAAVAMVDQKQQPAMSGAWRQAFQLATPILLTIIGWYYITGDQRTESAFRELNSAITALNNTLHDIDVQQAVNTGTLVIMLDRINDMEVRLRQVEIDHDAFRGGN